MSIYATMFQVIRVATKKLKFILPFGVPPQKIDHTHIFKASLLMQPPPPPIIIISIVYKFFRGKISIHYVDT